LEEENYFIVFFDRPNGAVCYRIVAWHLFWHLFDLSRSLGQGFIEERYKIFESNSQPKYRKAAAAEVVSKSKDTRFLKAIHN
ncbi:MAG: hypothetical protein IJP44_03760, partial [Bacteroidales bacterium]|nr:hypothetical protein [Bacteroidales bacterium]